MCSQTHWPCQYVHAPRAHVWKIKCWTGDWEQNRRFLSPFRFEFTWTRRVGEVKQILPSPSDVPLRGGRGGRGGWMYGDRGGVGMQSSFWQLLWPLTSKLEQNKGLGSPHRQKVCRVYVLDPGKVPALLVTHVHRLWNADRSHVWLAWLYLHHAKE